MSRNHRQMRVLPKDGLKHPRLADGQLDTLYAEWTDDDGSFILFDPDDAASDDAWLSADPDCVYEIGVDRRADR